jgi:DNA polymerase III subunit chi
VTRIDFYTNAESRVHVACRLTEKAFIQKLKVILFVPDPNMSKTVDKMLWSQRATGFVPHCYADSKLAHATPVLITHELANTGPDDLLINLGDECPASFGRFRRLVEIVDGDAQSKETARIRWRHYKERGYDIHHVDLAGSQQ